MDSILIIKTSALGDILQALPVLPYLRSRYPQAHISWVVEKKAEDLLALCPLIDEVIVIDSHRWRKSLFSASTRKELKALKKRMSLRSFCMVLDLQGNIKSGLITWIASSSYKAGFSTKQLREKMNAFFTNKKIEIDMCASKRKQYIDFVKKACKDDTDYIPSDITLCLKESECISKDAIMEKFSLTSYSYMIVALASIWENKMLSSQQAMRLIEHLLSSGDIFIIIPFFTAEEGEKASAIAKCYPQRCVAIGGVSLAVWYALMGSCKAVIAVDSCLLHLAAESGAPTFSIFGPSLARFFAPLGDRHSSFQGTCPFGVNASERCPRLRSCQSGACMKDLILSDLFFHIDRWLATLPSIVKEENLCTLPLYV